MLENKNACLVLDNGTTLKGFGYGATGIAVAELCFNTSMSGYQEIISDPSYFNQIIVFTFPHIGNVGVNTDDNESLKNSASGVITYLKPTTPSNWRKTETLDNWLKQKNVIGLYGIDTRNLTLQLRDKGAMNGVICHQDNSDFDIGKMTNFVKTMKIAQGPVLPGTGADVKEDVHAQHRPDLPHDQRGVADVVAAGVVLVPRRGPVQ